MKKTTFRQLITVAALLRYFVMYKLITEEEAMIALKTGRMPDDILERLRLADLKSKN